MTIEFWLWTMANNYDSTIST